MSGTAGPAPPDATGGPQDALPPEARVVRRRHLSPVWLVPVAAVAAAGWLAWSNYRERGPTVEIAFDTGEGLSAGETRVRHKAVELGTVTAARLADDMRRVVATVRMRREATPFLTDTARFWVVRPRLDIGSVSGIETLLSGSYIEMDPGAERGEPRRNFAGLADPPGVRSDEPGRTFQLAAERVGSVGRGSPVFFRDVAVGEVLFYQLPEGGAGPANIKIFVRAPYDRLVRPGSRFWNASGLMLQIGTEGVQLEIESLRALVSGGIAFDTTDHPADSVDPLPQSFVLHGTREEAEAAGYHRRVAMVAYFETAVRGLDAGAPVEMLGVRIGTVVDVALDPGVTRGERPRVRVRMEVQPERIAMEAGTALPEVDPFEVTRRLVGLGVRAQPRSANLLTGKIVIALEPVPDAPPAEVGREGDLLVVPSAGGGGIDDAAAAVAALARRLEALPLNRVVDDADGALRAAAGAMHEARELLLGVGTGLPSAVGESRETMARLRRALASFDRGYGAESGVRHDAQHALDQAGEAARAVRLLADYLARHPEALLRGRASDVAR